jgi:hypothetical protein
VTDIARWAQGVAGAWAVFVPYWLLTAFVAAWGRTSLSRVDLRRALLRTFVATVTLGFPAAGLFTYCAGFASSPKVSAATTGAVWALMLLPVYSALAACVAFEFAVQEAQKRGAGDRSPVIRAASALTLGLLVLLGIGILAAACFFTAGPKALG